MKFAQNVCNSGNLEHLTSQSNKIHGRFMGNIIKNNYALMKSRLIMYHFTCKYKLYNTHCRRNVTSNFSSVCDIFALFALNCVTDKYYKMGHSQQQMMEASYRISASEKFVSGYINSLFINLCKLGFILD
jgi:hypothetical protein